MFLKILLLTYWH